MGKLQDMYAAFAQLEELGLPISREQKEVLRNLEKAFVTDEIIPKIKEATLPLIKGVKASFSIKLDYDGENLSLKELNGYNESFDDGGYVREDESRKRSTIVKVTFPDGRVVCERFVKYTLAEVVRYAGCEKVYNLKYPMLDSYLVSKEKHPKERYAENQIEVEPGYYLLTTSNTDKKYQQIKFISNSLNLNLKIELVDVEEARSNTPVIDNIEKSGEEVKKYPNQNRSLYSLNSGQFLNKVQFMAEVVSELLRTIPEISYEELCSFLPVNSSNNRTLITREEWLNKNDDAKRRYLTNRVFTTADGIEFYVSTQWTKETFYKKVLPAVENLGFRWQEQEA